MRKEDFKVANVKNLSKAFIRWKALEIVGFLKSFRSIIVVHSKRDLFVNFTFAMFMEILSV